MSASVPPKTDSERISKLMNQSMQSSNKEDNPNSGRAKVRLRSNTIFAFQDDHIYSSIYSTDDDHHASNFPCNVNMTTNLSSDPLFIPQTNLNNSNFFSTVCDRSQWLKLTEATDAKNLEDDGRSIGSIAEDMERQLAFLNDVVDDDLNDAKLSLNEDNSIISEKSSVNHHGMHMNLTTPVPPKILHLIESEDWKNLNTGINTQQSFSSFLEKNQNFEKVSNCSSCMTDEKKKNTPIGANNQCHGMNNNLNNNINNNITNNNNILGSNILSVDGSSTITNQQNSELHAKSVDFTNPTCPYIFKSAQNLAYNKGTPSYLPNNNNIEYDSLNSFHSMNSFNVIPPPRMNINTPLAQSQQFLAQPLGNCSNMNMNMNMNPYSFCYDNKQFSQLYYRNSIDISRQSKCPNNFTCIQEDKSMIDNLLFLIKDQHGCRMIQKKLEEKSAEFNSKFFEKIKNSLYDIICDQFGNYVVQRYVENCNDKYIISKILEKIRAKLFEISINCYGTRGFQRLLDFISTDGDYDIVREFLVNKVYNLIKDVNGNHVIQKIIQIFPKDRNSFLMNEMTEHIVDICKLKQGSCVFLKALEKANDDDKKTMIMKIFENMDMIINDEHGNFIIQHILNLKQAEYTVIIYNYVKCHIFPLSKQKYSSNVIDKCILFDNSEFNGGLIDKLIELKCIPELIADQYGNYVIQKALQVSHGIKFLEIIDMIKKATKTLKQTNYGKKIYDNLLTNYGEYFTQNVTTNQKCKNNPKQSSSSHGKKQNNNVSGKK